jgi:hypothetical protein
LLRLCQRVIVEDVLIISTPLNKGLTLIPLDGDVIPYFPSGRR